MVHLRCINPPIDNIGQSEMLVSLDSRFGSNLGCKLCTHELR